MSLKKTIILLLCLATFYSCKTGDSVQDNKDPQSAAKDTLSGSFTISGAYALYPLVVRWTDNFMKLHPAVKIVVTSGGTGQGINDLLAKKNQLAMISRPLTDEDQTKGIWVLPVAKEGVALIVNQRNPYIKRILQQGITPEKLIKLFTAQKQVSWGDILDTTLKEKVVVYTRADESGATEVWAAFLWKQGTDLNGIKVTGDEEMIKNIQNNQLAIGYCNFSYAFDTINGDRMKDIQVVPIDLDFDKTIDRKEVPFTNINKAHRGLWLGYYPKNLTRELTFGSMGKPSDPAILAFLKYVLTTGQSQVAKMGFCELNDIYVAYSQATLK